MSTKLPAFVDLHCHCLPGLDDGPADLEASLALCQALVADGVKTAVATPHQLGPYEGQTAACLIRSAVESLRRELLARGVPLELLCGADVRLHERLADLLAADQVMTLADGHKWLLLEMPQEPFIDISSLLKQMQTQGMGVVFSHPERYPWIRRRIPQVLAWREEYGMRVQVTAASFLGDFGKAVMEVAWQLASLQAIDVVAGDAHSARGMRRPRMTDAAEIVAARVGPEAAEKWFVQTPAAIVAGNPIPLC